jgi:O-antigen biosynthesis protein
VRSRTWRILTGGGGLWRRAARRFRPRPGAAAIGPEQYRAWMASCEKRETPVRCEGPRLTVVTGDPRTLASLRGQTYRNWDTAEEVDAARGDYVLLPEPGAEYPPDALYLFARAAAEGAGLIYSDEDRLDGAGLRIDPWFKPDWSPDLLAATDYIGRAFAVRTSLARTAVAEICARTGNIAHVPRVLYHRRGPAAVVAPRRVRYPVPAGTRVDILIPSRNPALLGRCLRRLREKTAWHDYRVTVIDNSRGAEIAALAETHGARHVDWRGQPFNYAAMNNAAAAGSPAELLLFLNDDTLATDPGWLEALAEHAARPEIGAVGARLLYPGGAIQHAGVAIGIFGVCGHVFKGWPGDVPTYRGLGETVRNVAAVTGACLMMRAGVFRDAGGFDQRDFPVAYNDIDLCLRVLESGRRVVCTPYAVLEHHEARSKPWSQRDPEAREIRAFQARWSRYIAHDPYYNPNLTRADESYGPRGRDECG